MPLRDGFTATDLRAAEFFGL